MGLFEEQVARKPDHYPWSQEFISRMWHGFWTPNEFDFKSDYAQFKEALSEQERSVIVNTLSAIGQIEIAVKKFWSRLGDNLPHPSITDMGLVMASIEVIHNQAYEKLLTVLHLQDVFQENLRHEVIQGRVAYLRKYLDPRYTDTRKRYIYSLILFTLFIENVSLFSQFYIILWFNRYKNILKDTAQQVQYTKNEEVLHAQVGIKLIQTLREEYPELFDDELMSRVYDESMEAYLAESRLIDWILAGYSDGTLNAPLLKEYVKVRLNESLVSIGYSAIFVIDTELEKQLLWMNETVYGNAMTDFFNGKPVEYAKKNKTFNAEELF